MNILGMVFSILAALFIVIGALFQKQIHSHKMRRSYIGHFQAMRNLLSSHEEEVYKNFAHKAGSKGTRQEKKHPSQKSVPSFPNCNLLCARLNLLPLVFEGKEKEPLLFQMLVNLLDTFYGKTILPKEKQEAFTKDFLASLREAFLKEPEDFSLEKLKFKNPSHRYLLCKMLKGSKTCDLFAQEGYPSLSEYLCFSENRPKVCVKHAHPYMLSLFFGQKVAKHLYMQMHQQESFSPTKTMVEETLNQQHKLHDKALFSLLSFEKKRCQKERISSFTGKDEATAISLKKRVSL